MFFAQNWAEYAKRIENEERERLSKTRGVELKEVPKAGWLDLYKPKATPSTLKR